MSWITSGSELCNWVSQFLQNCSTPFGFRSCGVFFENSFILDYAAFGTMQLGFIIFYKIISLRSVPHNQARPTANPPSPINCCKQIQNGAVWDLFYARMQCLFYRLRHPPSFYSGVIPGAVINYFALYSEAGSLPRLKLRTDATPFSSQSGKADLRTGVVQGSEKPEPTSPKGGRRSALSEK